MAATHWQSAFKLAVGTAGGMEGCCVAQPVRPPLRDLSLPLSLRAARVGKLCGPNPSRPGLSGNAGMGTDRVWDLIPRLGIRSISRLGINLESRDSGSRVHVDPATRMRIS
jgi:hypothetical protein